MYYHLFYQGVVYNIQMTCMPDEWMFFKGKKIDFPIPEGIQTPIYVIGDSHVRVLPEVAPYLFLRSTDIEDVIDSKSAYAVGTKGHDVYLNESIRIIPDGSQVLLSFGEIDCRHYIPKKAIENNTSIEHEVDIVIERYTKNCVRILKEKFNVIIMGLYVCPDDHNHENNYYDILMAKLLLHLKLQHYAYMNNLVYVPLFETVLNKGWDICRLDYPHYFNDTSHLGACMIPVILDAIKNNNL